MPGAQTLLGSGLPPVPPVLPPLVLTPVVPEPLVAGLEPPTPVAVGGGDISPVPPRSPEHPVARAVRQARSVAEPVEYRCRVVLICGNARGQARVLECGKEPRS